MFLKNENFLVVQWLELCTFTAKDQSSVLDQEAKILQALVWSKKKKKKSNKTLKTVGEGRRGLLKQNYARIKKVENLFQSTSKKLFRGTPETSCLQRREVLSLQDNL